MQPASRLGCLPESSAHLDHSLTRPNSDPIWSDKAGPQQVLKQIRAEAEALFAEADRQYDEARQKAKAPGHKGDGKFVDPRPPADRAPLALNVANFPTLGPLPSASQAASQVQKWVLTQEKTRGGWLRQLLRLSLWSASHAGSRRPPNA